jgi:hypothetical protein
MNEPPAGPNPPGGEVRIPSRSSLEVTYPPGEEGRAFERLDAVVILPTLNEEEGLARTFESLRLDELRSRGWRVAPVVIDGGSTDRTLEVARAKGLAVLHQRSRGKGAAVREALEWVGEQGVPYALVMDADCTYPPEMIGPALSLLRTGSHLVVGVRSPVRTRPVSPRDIMHRVGNALLNWMATQVSRQNVLDLCSGFYAVDLTTHLHEGLAATGFEIESEMFLKAFRTGLRVVQIPIRYRLRVGTAKLRALPDGGRIFASILRSPQRHPRRAAPLGTASLVHGLLSACFVHGNRELVVLTHPKRQAEAERLVRSLEGTVFAHTLVVAEPTELQPGTLGSFERALATAWPHAAVVHLEGPASPDGSVGATAMYLPNTRRTIRLELDPTPMSVPAGVPPSIRGVARSGGRAAVAAPRVTRYLSSLQSVTPALDSTGFVKEMTLHGANGLKGRVVAVADAPPAPSYPLPFLTPEDRSTGGSST